MACCELLNGLAFSRFLLFRGCLGQALFPQFSIMDSKNGAKEYLIAKIGVDTAENEPCKVRKFELSGI